MADEQERERLAKARLAAAAALRTRQRRVAEVAAAAQQRAAVERIAGTDDPRVKRALAAEAKLASTLDGARGDLARSVAALGEALQAWLPATAGDEWQSLDARYPAVLMPVRLETRFARDPAGRDELRVRIYPDSLFVESHDAAVTRNEEDAGQAYWRSVWSGGVEAEAWRELLRLLPAPRAAWVVIATTPENLDQRPDAEPRFPTVEPRAGAWDRAPHATLLPDRWLFVGYRGGAPVRRAATGATQEPLALGFDPHAPGDAAVDVSGDGLVLDDELAWAIDFDRALKVGMALRVALSTDDVRMGFDRVLVIGIKASLAPKDAAPALERLLDGHHYTGGLALVGQGTPTNSTEAGRAGFPPPDPDGKTSFAVERGASLARAGGDGQRLATAIGVRPTAFAHIEGAGGGEQERSEAINRAVFPVTVGYFLRQMMAPHVSENDIAGCLEHFVAYVRGRGPLPALRVRRQPYGVLPVSSIERWESEPDVHGFSGELPTLLRRLRPLWLSASAKVPRLVGAADPDAALVDVLAMHPSSREVRVRTAQGPAWQRNVLAYLGLDAPAWEAERTRLAEPILQLVAPASWHPKLLELTFASSASRYRHPLVAQAPLSETRGLDPDYIRWVRQATLAELCDEVWPAGTPPPRTLLYQVLRHARLEELARVAMQLHIVQGVAAGEARDREFVGLTADDGPTRWQRLAEPVRAVSGPIPIGEFLLQDVPRDESKPVRDQANALATLDGVATAELDRLFSECLDLGSHRLDAWLTSLATRRLGEMRAQAPVGAHLGGFGWVEDLRPRRDQPASDGHILAPSLDHAAAAAVLRSGYLTRNAAGTGAYALDLSSARIREALAVLDAARGGESPGAILGARFERALREHPRRLARFIEPLRRRYPLVAGKADAEAEPPEVQATGVVVDGLALRRAFLDGVLDLVHPDFASGDVGRDTIDRGAVGEELTALDRVIDGLADLLLAESVYQAVAGSASGADATLDAMTRGTIAPDPAITGQPRPSLPIHHRVALVLSSDLVLSPGWPSAQTPRSRAEPRVDAWLGQQLGDPRRVRCRATVTPTGEAPRTVDVTLADLALQPIDVIALADATPGEGGPASELELRIADAARAGDASATVTLELGRDPSVSPDASATFPEFLELARALRRVLAQGRPLVARDLVTPADAPTLPPPSFDADTQARASGARADLARTAASLAAARTSGDTPALTAALRGAALLGIPGAYPRTGDETNKAPNAAAEIARCMAAAAVTDPVGVATAVFGPAFPFVPTCMPSNADQLGRAMDRSESVTGSEESRMRWLAQTSRVRPALDGWRRAMLLAEALGAAPLSTVVAQLPLREGDRWVALPFGGGGGPPVPGTVSLMLLDLERPSATEPWAGLVLDEWGEAIPEAESTTAAAFHFDTPGAEAAQCILIAVPPRRTPTWHLDDILAILVETLDLARIRAVDLELLGSLGQVVPATYLAANAANDTVSTSFVGALVADAPSAVRAEDG